MYTLDYDQPARTLVVAIRGCWTPLDLAQFSVVGLARAGTIRVRHGEFAILLDLTHAPIQPQALMPGIAPLLAQTLKLTSARIATVVGSTLAKLQAERVMSAPTCRTFLDMEEAKAWIAANRADR
jgi:hypothetical protein